LSSEFLTCSEMASRVKCPASGPSAVLTVPAADLVRWLAGRRPLTAPNIEAPPVVTDRCATPSLAFGPAVEPSNEAHGVGSYQSPSGGAGATGQSQHPRDTSAWSRDKLKTTGTPSGTATAARSLSRSKVSRSMLCRKGITNMPEFIGRWVAG
jgi:hypothetical protein